MKKQIINKNMRKYVIAAICVIAAAAGMTGGFATHQIKEQKLQEEAKAEMEQLKKEEAVAMQEEEEETKEASANIKAKESSEQKKDNKKQEKTSQEQTASIVKRNGSLTEENENSADLETAETSANIQAAQTVEEEVAEVAFTDSSTLIWPVNGDVILDYNMDQMVYFATLKQYKYNPAVLIQAEVNEKVCAATTGKIVDISTNEETGQTVCMDIGGGYQLTYGQLKELEYELSDVVEQGAIIGYVSEPTKYYVVEGTNLYFSMTKDGESVDPLEFIRSE